MSNHAILSVEHLGKVFKSGERSVNVLSDVSFVIEGGSTCAIVGPSGSGKTTLIAICAGLERPSEGAVVFDGVALHNASEDELAHIRNQKIGFVFQGFNLLSRTTALENVELPTLYAHISRAEGQTRAQDALKLVGLGERMLHFPSQLSGGQQQRVAIARALVNQPALLLADEPTGNLDSRTSIEIMDVLQKLNAKGLTIVLVTHEPDIATFAKRTIQFRDGKIRQDELVADRPVAAEVLRQMPVLED